MFLIEAGAWPCWGKQDLQWISGSLATTEHSCHPSAELWTKKKKNPALTKLIPRKNHMPPCQSLFSDFFFFFIFSMWELQFPLKILLFWNVLKFYYKKTCYFQVRLCSDPRKRCSSWNFFAFYCKRSSLVSPRLKRQNDFKWNYPAKVLERG